MALLDKAYILAAVRDLLDEQSSVKWTDDQLNKWVQEAAMDISIKTLGYEDTDFIITAANTFEYDEPSESIKLHSCILGGGRTGCSTSIGSLINNFEFEPTYCNFPEICSVAGDVYAIVWQGVDLDGFLCTVEIDTDGNITQSVIDTWEFDATKGQYPEIIKVASNIFAVFYGDSLGYGSVFTVAIVDHGTISKSKIASADFDDGSGNKAGGEFSIPLEIASNYFLIASTGHGGDGFVHSFNISDDGATVTQVDVLEFEIISCAYPTIVHVSGTTYAVVYSDAGNDGILKTFSVSAIGVIGNSVIASLEFESGLGAYCTIVHARDNYFAVAYRGPGNDGFLEIIEISDDGATLTEIDEYEFDPGTCYDPRLVKLADNNLMVGYRGAANIGTIATFEVDEDGSLGSATIDTLELDDTYAGEIKFCKLGSTCNYAVVYVGPDSDGWLKTFEGVTLVRSTNYKGLSRIHPRLIHHVMHNETGEPKHYYHHHSKIGFWPLPDDAYAVTAYTSKVTDDITDLPTELRLLAIPYCLAMARLSEGWEDDFEQFIGMYLNSLMPYRPERGQYKLNAVDSRDMFKIPDGKVVNG